MKISYRTTSVAVLSALALDIASQTLFIKPKAAPGTAAEWDPCTAMGRIAVEIETGVRGSRVSRIALPGEDCIQARGTSRRCTDQGRGYAGLARMRLQSGDDVSLASRGRPVWIRRSPGRQLA